GGVSLYDDVGGRRSRYVVVYVASGDDGDGLEDGNARTADGHGFALRAIPTDVTHVEYNCGRLGAPAAVVDLDATSGPVDVAAGEWSRREEVDPASPERDERG